jgi:hypothetical protein
MSKNPNTNKTNGSNGKQELNKLFIAYETIEAKVDAAERELVLLNAEKSAAVKAIAEKAAELGFGNGPFNRNGRHLSLSTRQGYETKVVEKDGKEVEVKVPVGEPTYFFRGPKAAAIDLG